MTRAKRTEIMRDAYAVQDTDGLWVICKVYAGHMEVSPYGWNDKEIAERHAATLRAEYCKVDTLPHVVD